MWDYDPEELKKTEEGRVKILERMIQFGPDKGRKINLNDVMEYWEKLGIDNNRRRLMELLIWDRYQSWPLWKKILYARKFSSWLIRRSVYQLVMRRYGLENIYSR